MHAWTTWRHVCSTCTSPRRPPAALSNSLAKLHAGSMLAAKPLLSTVAELSLYLVGNVLHAKCPTLLHSTASHAATADQGHSAIQPASALAVMSGPLLDRLPATRKTRTSVRSRLHPDTWSVLRFMATSAAQARRHSAAVYPTAASVAAASVSAAAHRLRHHTSNAPATPHGAAAAASSAGPGSPEGGEDLVSQLRATPGWLKGPVGRRIVRALGEEEWVVEDAQPAPGQGEGSSGASGGEARVHPSSQPAGMTTTASVEIKAGAMLAVKEELGLFPCVFRLSLSDGHDALTVTASATWPVTSWLLSSATTCQDALKVSCSFLFALFCSFVCVYSDQWGFGSG
jgi:hypothetical protein